MIGSRNGFVTSALNIYIPSIHSFIHSLPHTHTFLRTNPSTYPSYKDILSFTFTRRSSTEYLPHPHPINDIKTTHPLTRLIDLSISCLLSVLISASYHTLL